MPLLYHIHDQDARALELMRSRVEACTRRPVWKEPGRRGSLAREGLKLVVKREARVRIADPIRDRDSVAPERRERDCLGLARSVEFFVCILSWTTVQVTI